MSLNIIKNGQKHKVNGYMPASYPSSRITNLDLDHLQDTDLSSPSNGQALVYDEASGKWVNSTLNSALAGLSDVDIDSPSEGQTLVYNPTTEKWENVDAPASSPNPNLLMNPWFTVNQRGWTSGSQVNNQYCVDRWKMSGSNIGTIEASSNGLILTSSGDYTNIIQYTEIDHSLDGKTLTLSLILSDGTIYSHTFVREYGTDATKTVGNLSFKMYGSGNVGIVVNGNDSFTIRAIKLELGSTSTLALDTAPDYTTELLKCQRYYYQVTSSVANQFLFPGVGATSATARCFVPLTTKMRITPTFSYSGTFSLQIGNTTTSCNSLGLSSAGDSGAWVSATVASGVSSGQASILRADTIGAYLAFDAEL